MKGTKLTKPNLKTVKKTVAKGWGKHNQMIVAVIAGTCAIMAVVEAVRASDKARDIKETRKIEIDNATSDLKEEAITQEDYKKQVRNANLTAAKNYALCYGKTAAFLVVSVGSTAYGYKISIGKQAALIGAYKALELKYDDFVGKAKEVIGDKKVDEIRGKIMEDHVNNSKMPAGMKPADYEVDEKGNFVARPYDYPFYDDFSGQYFMSTVTKVDQAMVKAAQMCAREMSVSMNDIYELLGGEAVGLHACGAGSRNGFIADDLTNNNGLIPYKTFATLRRDDGYEGGVTVLFIEPQAIGFD